MTPTAAVAMKAPQQIPMEVEKPVIATGKIRYAIGGQDRREKELVPGEDGREDGGGDDAGLRQRQRDFPEDIETPTSHRATPDCSSSSGISWKNPRSSQTTNDMFMPV